jgi:hypothetical protein
MRTYLRAVVHTQSNTLGKAVLRAQAEPGLNVATKIGRTNASNVNAQVAELLEKQVELLDKIEERDATIAKNGEVHARALAGKDMLIRAMREEIGRLGGVVPEELDEGGDDSESISEHSETVDDIMDKLMTEKYWEDILAMFAVRWNNEIIAEKSCILTGGFATKVVIKGPHSAKTQLMLLVMFLIAELIADSITVRVMDKYYGVPFLRLPSIDYKSNKFRKNVLVSSLTLVAATFLFYFAHGTTEEYSNSGGTESYNNSSSVAECVVVSGCANDVCVSDLCMNLR